jgi:hypothetical protein
LDREKGKKGKICSTPTLAVAGRQEAEILKGIIAASSHRVYLSSHELSL